MRSDARKRTEAQSTCACGRAGDHIRVKAIGCGPVLAARVGFADDILAPIVALAESADRQFGSAQVITRDALWAAIAVARGEQS